MTQYKSFCALSSEDERLEKIAAICADSSVKILDLLEECKQDLITTDEDQRSMAIQFISMCVYSGIIIDTQSQAFLLTFLVQKIQELLVLSHLLRAINHLLSLNDELECGNLINLIASNFNVQSEKQQLRKQLMDLLLTWIVHPKTIEFNDESLLQLLEMLEGEKDPRNLTVSFVILQKVASKWKIVCAKNASAFLDASFCYFPITFKPPANDPFGVAPEQLKELLNKTLVSCEDALEFLVPLLLEKLSSDSLVAKKDSWSVLVSALKTYECKIVADYFEPLLRHLERDSFNEELCELCIEVGDELVAKFGFEPFMQVFSKNYTLFSCFSADEKAFEYAISCAIQEKNLLNLNSLLKREETRFIFDSFASSYKSLVKNLIIEEIQQPQEQIVPLLQCISISISLNAFSNEEIKCILQWLSQVFSKQQEELVKIAIIEGIICPILVQFECSEVLLHFNLVLTQHQSSLKCMEKLCLQNASFSQHILSLLREEINSQNILPLIPAAIQHSSNPIQDLTAFLNAGFLKEEQFLRLAPTFGWNWMPIEGGNFEKISKFCAIMHPESGTSLSNFIGSLLHDPKIEPLAFSAWEIAKAIELDSLFDSVLCTFDFESFKSTLYQRLFPLLIAEFTNEKESVEILISVCKYLPSEIRQKCALFLLNHIDDNNNLFVQIVRFFSTFDFPEYNSHLLPVIRSKFFQIHNVHERLLLLDFFEGIHLISAHYALREFLADKKRLVRERAAFLLNDLHLRLA
jgi:hypothetical protein